MRPQQLQAPPPTLNQVLSLFTFECAPQPWAIVGAVGFSAMIGLWSVFSPSWKDVVKEGPHRRSWIHALKVVLEDAEEIKPKWFVVYEEVSYALFEFFDLIAFWWMVAEAEANAILNWESMAWQMSPCFPHPAKHYIYSNTVAGEYVVGDGEWQPAAAFFNLKTTEEISETGLAFSFPPNTAYSFHCAVGFTGVFSELPIPMDMRIVDDSTGKVIHQNSYNPEKTDVKNTTGIFLNNHLSGPNGISFHVEFRQAVTAERLLNPTSGNLAVEWQVFPTTV